MWVCMYLIDAGLGLHTYICPYVACTSFNMLFAQSMIDVEHEFL